MFRKNIISSLSPVKINKNFFHGSKNIFSSEKLTENLEKVAKKRRWPKILLVSTVLPSGAFLVYYELALNSQEKRKVRVQIESLGRAFTSFSVGLTIALDYKWNLYNLDENTDEYNKTIRECHARSADRMVSACIQNGGLYVKLGQGLSTMNHILPKEFYLTLRKLQNEALRSKGNDIDLLFKEEFGKTPNEVFKEFDYKPLAAASLAQVHKAVDKDGNELAVKLQYIDLQDRFSGDVFTCRCILKMIGWTFKDFNFSWVLDELKDTLAKELDFINEANNSKRCFNELKHLKYVHVPKVYDNLTTTRVLTMEFINGVKISDTEAIKNMGLDLKEIDEKLVKLFAAQIFQTGFVHADPHHGNIFVRKLAGTKNNAEIVLLDHGLYDSINEKDRKNLCKLWKAIILKDENKMKYYSSQLNVDEKHFLVFAAFVAMRPLHRPIHDKFIFNSDWLRMSEKERQAATQEGKFRLPTPREFKTMKKEELNEWRAKFKPYIEELKESVLHVFRTFPKCLLLVSRFCEMLTMEPPLSRLQGLKFKAKLNEEDILKMRESIRSQFDRVQIILKQLNSYMLLVFRNLNTVRSIIHDHGNLVDRHTIMARSAIYGAYKEEAKLGWKSKIRAWFELKTFDIILAYDYFTRWATTKYMQLMIRFGQVQSELLQEINHSMSSNDFN